ncbi:oxidoreductase [Pseudoclavibacter endophyticus]|uniref:SDR family oxidoreductase n=1 Tax=Pseudoclavibacter endophyticus TaxID=1778590 RepID=A0A6H9WW78_9MICO|nr:SDR family oxidoreductase [Pseudoclavibacter endophyticus]GGA68320.1 oxidoreductase [Pseudoclavibacter endophyticus]
MEITDFSLASFSLEGRTAIVTGGNSGLGQAFTLALAAAGANVFVPSVHDDGGETAELVAEAGAEHAGMLADLTAPGGPERVMAGAVDAFGRVDVLVNSAGINVVAPWRDFGRAEWDRMLAVNLTAAFELGRLAAQHMSDRGSGKIINIASLYSFLGGLGSPAYAATKHGIVGFTRAYADELGPCGVQVNAIAPGYFETALTAATRSEPETSRRILEHVPSGRWGERADLMGAVVFLASRASDYITGQVLTVDGGYLVR